MKHIPISYRRVPAFCGKPEQDKPIKVSRAAIGALLALPKYVSVDTAELVGKANTRLILCNRKALLTVGDRATAIAVLEGIKRAGLGGIA